MRASNGREDSAVEEGMNKNNIFSKTTFLNLNITGTGFLKGGQYFNIL